MAAKLLKHEIIGATTTKTVLCAIQIIKLKDIIHDIADCYSISYVPRHISGNFT